MKLHSNLFGNRKGISKILSISIVAGIIISALTLGMVFIPEFFRSKNGNDVSSQVVMVSADNEIVNLSDAINDLENSGCVIVNVTDVANWGQGIGFRVEYKEFRKVALKQKTVFLLYDYANSDCFILTTTYENFVIVWSPEPKIKQHTKFEKVEIQTAVCTISEGNWTIRMKLKNTGTTTATLTDALINNVEVDKYGVSGAVQNKWATNMTRQTSIPSGQTKIIEFYIDPQKSGTPLSSGTTVNINIHSTGGMDYIKLVELV